MSDATDYSTVHKIPVRWLLVPLAFLVFLAPAQAMGQCFAVSGGNWTDQIWSDTESGSAEPAADLDCAGTDGKQYPDNGDGAVIVGGNAVTLDIDMSSSGEGPIDSLKIQGGSNTRLLLGDGNNFEASNDVINNSAGGGGNGFILENLGNGGDATADDYFGAGRVFSEGTQTLTVTDTMQVDSGGNVQMNGANITVSGDIVNDGNINMGGGTLDISSGQFDNNSSFKVGGLGSVMTNSFTTSGLIDLGTDEAALTATSESTIENNGEVRVGSATDTVDVDARLNVNSGGVFQLADASLLIAGTFDNDGEFKTNAGATVTYDATSTNALEGDFSDANNNQIPRLVVASGTLNPADVLNKDDPDNNPVTVSDSLAVNSGATYGDGDASSNTVNEGSDLIFDGARFDVQGDLFANEVSFSRGNGNTTVASGAVFGTVVVSGNTTLEISDNNFDVIGLVQVSTQATVDVATNSTTLRLLGDVLIDGSLDAVGGTIAFVGEGQETTCSFDGGSAFPDLSSCTTNNIQEIDADAITFGNVVVDSSGTAAQFGSESNEITVDGSLTIKDGNLNMYRPFRLTNNLNVSGGTVDFDKNSALLLTGGSGVDIITNGSAEIPKMTVDMNTDTGDGSITTLNNDLVIDTLKMHRGVFTLDNNSNLDINHTLRLGNPSNPSRDAVVDPDGGVANNRFSFRSVSGGSVTLVSDGSEAVTGSNNTDDASIRYIDDSGTAGAEVNGKLNSRFRLTNKGFHFLSSPDNSGALTFNELLDRNNGQPDDSLFVRGVTGGDQAENLPQNATVQLWDESHIVDDADTSTVKLFTWKAIDCRQYSNWEEEYCEDAAASNPSNPIYDGTVTYPSTGLSDPMVHGRGYAIDAGATFDRTDANAPITLEQKFSPREDLSFDFLSDGPDMVGFKHDDNSIEADFDGWNLIGNPYFSQMDWCGNPGISKSDLASAFYIWDPAAGAWEGYDCTTGSFGPTADSNNEKILDDGVIAPMQGFMVRVIGSSPTVSIDNIATAQKDSADAFISKSTGGSGFAPRVGLTLSTPEHGYRTNVAFVEGAKLDTDKQETLYRNGGPKYSPPTMYSVLDNGKAAVVNNLPKALSDSLAEADAETATVPLHVDGCDNGTAVSGTAEIQASNLRSLPANWKVTLKDTEADETTPLSESSTYSFELNGSCSTSKAATPASKTTQENQPPMPRPVTHAVSKDGSADTRFQLIIDPDGGSGDGSDDGSGSTGSATEIELSDFDVQTVGEQAKLNWDMVTNSVDAVEIQHKFEDAASFETVTKIQTAAFSKKMSEQTVTLTEQERKEHDLDAAGTHTFRLRASDGTVSEEKTVDLGLSGEYELSTYPNPVSSQATVEVAVKEKTDVTISLYNTLGQKVRTVARRALPAEKTEYINLDVKGLGSGLYFIRMKGDGINATQRMTVVR